MIHKVPKTNCMKTAYGVFPFAIILNNVHFVMSCVLNDGTTALFICFNDKSAVFPSLNVFSE